MSEPASVRRVYRIVAMLLAAGAAAGCGYKGPLFLPPAAGGDTAAEQAPAQQPPALPEDPAGQDDDSLFHDGD